MTTLRFYSRADRDTAARNFKRDGHQVRKSSVRGCVLSPDYVIGLPDDYVKSPGLGGSSEPTLFAAIYNLEVVR